MVFDIHGDIWTDVAAKREEGLENIIKNYHCTTKIYIYIY